MAEKDRIASLGEREKLLQGLSAPTGNHSWRLHGGSGREGGPSLCGEPPAEDETLITPDAALLSDDAVGGGIKRKGDDFPRYGGRESLL